MKTPKEIELYPGLSSAYHASSLFPETFIDPSSDQLADMWQDIMGEPAKIIDGLLGVMHIPNGTKYHSLISVDLCDVVRKTCESFMSLEGLEVEAAGHEYSYGRPFGIHGDDEIIKKIVQGIMVQDLVEPVDNIEEIHEILLDMRQSGAIIMANTSTLPGCERATLKFMNTYLKDAFDGILLPRNHDGNGKITKGMAKIAVYKEIELLDGHAHIRHTQHIDDAPHHIRGSREAAQELGITNHFDATPLYPWNRDHTDMNHTETPLEAFIQAYETFERINKHGR